MAQQVVDMAIQMHGGGGLSDDHPLAGMSLRLALKVRDVRKATAEEIEARSVGASPITVLASAPAATPGALH